MTSRPPPLTSSTLSRPSVKTSRNSMSVSGRSRTTGISHPKYTVVSLSSASVGRSWQQAGRRGIFWETRPGAASCCTKPVSNSSKMNLPPHKTAPSSKAGAPHYTATLPPSHIPRTWSALQSQWLSLHREG